MILFRQSMKRFLLESVDFFGFRLVETKKDSTDVLMTRFSIPYRLEPNSDHDSLKIYFLPYSLTLSV